MHTLYTTECIVLGSSNFSEANKYIYLFTKDIGLVRAMARSVREEKSKLRFNLQDFSRGYVTLVRGREVWRITGALEKYSVYEEFKYNKEKLFIIARILNLLQRLIHGEEKNEYLFASLVHGFDFIRLNAVEKENAKNFEYLSVLRLLYSLGYIAKKEEFSELLELTEIDEELLKKTESKRKQILFAINGALKETHL